MYFIFTFVFLIHYSLLGLPGLWPPEDFCLCDSNPSSNVPVLSFGGFILEIQVILTQESGYHVVYHDIAARRGLPQTLL